MTPSSSPSSSVAAYQDGQCPSANQLTSNEKQATTLMLRADGLQQMECYASVAVFLPVTEDHKNLEQHPRRIIWCRRAKRSHMERRIDICRRMNQIAASL